MCEINVFYLFPQRQKFKFVYVRPISEGSDDRCLVVAAGLECDSCLGLRRDDPGRTEAVWDRLIVMVADLGALVLRSHRVRNRLSTRAQHRQDAMSILRSEACRSCDALSYNESHQLSIQFLIKQYLQGQ